ncbi:hypothetical protein BDA96_05G175100 [Sorghum bicolor]|uniref:Uncharacterized protein n=1 Tax=Sorghum bicolor TaxID=4558 RepID=A0A921QZ48_SORBI|nr:hypothetical protein BDA96_05G175100 [Sorghum bicolor]KAG0530313.1 hypothetical protein BDA96_05G175100 [Sorghum bicolor]
MHLSPRSHNHVDFSPTPRVFCSQTKAHCHTPPCLCVGSAPLRAQRHPARRAAAPASHLSPSQRCLLHLPAVADPHLPGDAAAPPPSWQPVLHLRAQIASPWARRLRIPNQGRMPLPATVWLTLPLPGTGGARLPLVVLWPCDSPGPLHMPSRRRSFIMWQCPGTCHIFGGDSISRKKVPQVWSKLLF